MAHSAPTPGQVGPAAPEDSNPWAAGGTMFAGVLLLVDGAFGVIKGIAGIASDEVYTRIGSYTFEFSVAAWGWIHLVVGIVLGFVGWGILRGALWARATGVVIAAINLIVNFVWLPYHPVWAVISIAIDTFVIWALCTDRSKVIV
ncbi:hypothetical protein [Streptomyces sp. ML-6]|uniref:DUF7144 family membrane protein n=1 Tax=unclassified Streptomyces TaxID=2593676 RepID=UPI0024C08D53|nr:hypothetical protein [Streptomyces sp. ML-6]MDK0519267.1 hypothetical protein [Streptomyces sp. ML-6]